MTSGIYRLVIWSVIVLLLGLLTAERASSQDRPERRVVQFTGLLLTGDSLKPLPYASVWVQNTGRGTTTDHYGFFSIPVYDDDILRFSAVGYNDVYYGIPDTLTQRRYSAVQLMTRDTIHLPETVIYPWPTKEQFRHAFIHSDIPSDDYDRAMRNLAQAEMRERFENMPMDGSMNFKAHIQQHADRMYYAGQSPPIRIFNPLAWAEFIEAWREGRFRRDN